MPTRLYINLCQVYIPMYLHVSLSMPAASLAYIPLAMFLSSFLISLIIERLNTKLGRKVAYSIGVLFAICASIWIQFGKGDMYIKYEIYPVAVMLGKYDNFIHKFVCFTSITIALLTLSRTKRPRHFLIYRDNLQVPQVQSCW